MTFVPCQLRGWNYVCRGPFPVWLQVRAGTRETYMRFEKESEAAVVSVLWKLVKSIGHCGSSYTTSLIRSFTFCWRGTSPRPTAPPVPAGNPLPASPSVLDQVCVCAGHSNHRGWGQQETNIGFHLSSWVPVCLCSANFTPSFPSQRLAG